MKKVYQLILVFYLAAGIAVSGYFYLYPQYYKKINIVPASHKPGEYSFQSYTTYSYEEGNEFGVSVLATIVGSVLIGGIGFVMCKPK
jgi:hypothetical protein